MKCVVLDGKWLRIIVLQNSQGWTVNGLSPLVHFQFIVPFDFILTSRQFNNLPGMWWKEEIESGPNHVSNLNDLPYYL